MIEKRIDEIIGTVAPSPEAIREAIENPNNQVVELHKTEQSYKSRLLELQKQLNIEKQRMKGVDNDTKLGN